MIRKFIALLLLSVTLCGCGNPTPAPTEIPTETPTAASTEIPTVAPTEPPSLVIPGLTADDVVRYFSEVCLDAEIIHSGDPSVLQKWAMPISYAIYGDPTGEDWDTLTGFVTWLNGVEGFPSIAPAENADTANLRIHFCDKQRMLDLMGDQFYGMDGAVTFWYEEDAIYDAIICIRTDLEQNLRNSVILEELYNSLGPIQDTALRPDSIIYADYSEPQALTAVDELILQLLYHPHITCGMDASQCEAVIRELYR